MCVRMRTAKWAKFHINVSVVLKVLPCALVSCPASLSNKAKRERESGNFRNFSCILYAYTTNSPHQSIVLHVCHLHRIILSSSANLSQTQTHSPLLLYFLYCHPFYVHHLWNITYMYIKTHPLCPYLMLSSLKPLLSSYPLMVLVSRICKRFYLNIPLISLIHMTNSYSLMYGWLASVVPRRNNLLVMLFILCVPCPFNCNLLHLNAPLTPESTTYFNLMGNLWTYVCPYLLYHVNLIKKKECPYHVTCVVCNKYFVPSPKQNLYTCP